MNRRQFTKLISFSVLSALGLLALDGCVIRPVEPVGTAGPERRRSRRRVRRRVRRRMRRRMIGSRVVYVIPKQTLVGEEIIMDDGSKGVVNSIKGNTVEIQTQGRIKSMPVEFE